MLRIRPLCHLSLRGIKYYLLRFARFWQAVFFCATAETFPANIGRGLSCVADLGVWDLSAGANPGRRRLLFRAFSLRLQKRRCHECARSRLEDGRLPLQICRRPASRAQAETLFSTRSGNTRGFSSRTNRPRRKKGALFSRSNPSPIRASA